MKRKYKISFCTVCMNRLEHLKQTLPRNIEDNISYGNIEFVVLNYNSKDKLDEWIGQEMSHYLNTGVLVYIRTNLPQYFLRSHSKNVAAKNASGDIICNVDADNYLGKGFAKYVNKQFGKEKNSYLAVQKSTGKRDCYGRICVLKDDFMEVTGYDESMTHYGFEDFDLLNRLNMLGRKAKYISKEKFLEVVNHDDFSRIENESHIKEVEKIYIRYINYYSSEILYFFENGIFFKGTIIANELQNSKSINNIFKENRKWEYRNSLENSAWKTGTWYKNASGTVLKFKETEILLVLVKKGCLRNTKCVEKVYYECGNAKRIQELVMFLSQINNRMKMVRNKDENRIRVNSVFGEIDLFKANLCNQ